MTTSKERERSRKEATSAEKLLEVREAMKTVREISQLLNTGLDDETLRVCVQLLEAGVNPEALATVVQELRRETGRVQREDNKSR
ncbi:mitotic-spindle organizing protein 1-like [Halichondria panicea]|uniref:mitotic-spindle organizing protein 1-like n=1 Tax=Halichondria panicea TaxID=6063 RepID=UPI00312B3862